MNAPLPPLPASLSRTDAQAGNLDERILRVEQRLIAREEQLRRGVHAFGRRLEQALQPRRLVKPALIGLAGLAALLVLPRLLPRRPRRALRQAAPQAGEAAAAVAKPAALFALLASLPWNRLLGSVWPALPQKLRERVSPETVGSMITVALPLLESVSTWRRAPRR